MNIEVGDTIENNKKERFRVVNITESTYFGKVNGNYKRAFKENKPKLIKKADVRKDVNKLKDVKKGMIIRTKSSLYRIYDIKGRTILVTDIDTVKPKFNIGYLNEVTDDLKHLDEQLEILNYKIGLEKYLIPK